MLNSRPKLLLHYVPILLSLLIMFCRSTSVSKIPQPVIVDTTRPVAQICSSPAGLKTVEVHTEKELQQAVSSLRSNMEVRISAGVYMLSQNVVVPKGLSNIVIRGATGNRDDVKLIGKGMNKNSVPSGIWMSHVNQVLLADLTIQDVYYHAVTLNEDSDNVTICNVHLRNAGDQILKSNPSRKRGNRNGIVEHSLFDFENTATDDYTRGIDVIHGSNWIIRDNIFRNIRAPKGAGIVGPTILMWKSTINSIVERNQFYNCQTGIGFGLVERKPDDHTGGIIRNNFFYREKSEIGDVGITVADSPRTKVLNNTILLNGTFERAIEYRFTGAKNVEIKNNLTDAPIISREGGTAILVSNITNASSAWFLNQGDVHLTHAAEEAIGQGTPDIDLQDDIDGEPRKRDGVDIGADQSSPQ
jgi:hypothetical protein